MYAAPDQRTPDQAKSLALSDALIDELFAADTIVVAVPMHNFGVPSTLKAWIDHISRAGRTFSYGANGPQGLLKGKHAILVLASGGVYSNGQMKAFDFTEPYLRAVLGFLGITNVDVVRVEGVATSAIGPEKALVAANTQSKQLVAGLG
jgi:FMN-dependent NADH-azoreductase